MPHTGIRGLDTLPWGTHLCLFYKSGIELRQLLTPYFQTGLADGESCVWVTGPSFTEQEVLDSVQQIHPQVSHHLETGQLEILPYTACHLTTGIFRSEAMLESWSSKLERAIDRGFSGLRIAGDTSWLTSREQRQEFLVYEKRLTHAASVQRLLTLCAYPSSDWAPDEMLTVMQSHGSVLLPGKAGWKAIDVRCG